MADSALLDNGQKSPPKAMLVCSSGGHLLQLHRLKPWWVKRERVWVTFDMPDSRSLLAGGRPVGLLPNDPERGQSRPESGSRVAPPPSRPPQRHRLDGSGCRLSFLPRGSLAAHQDGLCRGVRPYRRTHADGAALPSAREPLFAAVGGAEAHLSARRGHREAVLT